MNKFYKFSIVFTALFFTLFSGQLLAQTVTTVTSTCVNNGIVTIAGVPGTGPFAVVVTAFPPDYDPVTGGGNRTADGISDVYAALYPGAYTFQYTDGSGTVQNINATVTGNYVIPSNADYQPAMTPETGCINANNGQINGVMSNGLAPYTYTILSGPTSMPANNTGSFSGLAPGNYQIQAEDACGNLQTRNVQVTDFVFAVSTPVINAVSCTSFTLDNLSVTPFPTGGSYEIVQGGTTVGSGTSLPVTFTATKNDVINGAVEIRVKDACGDFISVPSGAIANDWAFTAVSDQIVCGTGLEVLGITTTGTITSPYTTTLTVTNPSLAPQTITGYPTTVAGVTAATNPLQYNIAITDACGVTKTQFLDKTFYASGSLAYANCTAVDATTNVSGVYNAPVTYTINPDPNSAGSNTTGAFPGLPTGSYVITGTDACGKSTTASVIFDKTFDSYAGSEPYCKLDTFRTYVGIPSRAYGTSITVQQYRGTVAQVAAGTAVLGELRTFTSYAGCPNNPNVDQFNNCGSVDFENTIANETTTYVVLDQCGTTDTVTVTNGPVGHKPIVHSASATPKCINIGDIKASAVSDAPYWNSVQFKLWNINTPGTIINTANTLTNTPTDYTIASTLPVGTYVVETSLLYCPTGTNTYYDTVKIEPYKQPRIGASLNFVCPPAGPNSSIVLNGRGGIPNYTFQLLNSVPAGLVLPDIISSQTATENFPGSYNLLTFRIVDQCFNGTTKTIPLKPAPNPVVKVIGPKPNGCVTPINQTLYIDSTIYGSNAVYQWYKLPDLATVIDNTPSLPIALPGGDGTYQVEVSIPNTCFDKTATKVVAPLPTACTNEIGNYVWNDADSNGVQGATEVGISGVTVTLFNTAGAPIATTKTDAYGKYLFTDLPDGSYSVGFTTPANYILTQSITPGDNANNTNSDASPITGKTTPFILAGGESDLTADAGMYVPQPILASLGDKVFLDVSKDGIQDPSEPGVAGVTVTLYDAAGLPVGTTITDASGKYNFAELQPGTYSVGFTQPPGYVFTGQDATGAASNINGSADYTDSDVNPANGKTSQVTLVGGENNTGIDAGIYRQDPLKAALGNRIWNDVDGDGIQDANEAGVAGVTVNLLDISGGILSTTVTDELGNYMFNNLDAGTYGVEFVPSSLPSGFTFTSQNASPSEITDSDVNPADGKVAGIVLGAGEINLNIDAGIINTALPIGGLGTTVWYDRDKNGIQDAGENGVPGVKVVLYNASGTPIDSSTTDNNGNYAFNNLADGNYSVGFSNLPDGFGYTTKDAGSDAVDSDPNGAGRTANVSVTAGGFNPTVDGGIIQSVGNNATASLGDRVWNDVNNNGMQDAGENGVQGVTVTLFGPDGTTVIKTTTTDALGNYIFTGLPAADYVVGFSNIPAGFAYSTAGQGTDPAKDANADATTGGKTGVISLSDGEENLSIDAGIHEAPGLASLGNYVWFDQNQDGIQNVDESGVPGVTVTLYDNAGVAIANTTTDANGLYQFTGLVPATYSVGFSNLPENYTFTGQDATGASANATTGDATDSDVNPGNGKTSAVTLVAGQNYPDLDAGIFTDKAALGNYVWDDVNNDGIQEPTEKGIPGVTVTLFDENDLPVASAVTDANGYYYFPNLEPGDYTLGFKDIPNGSSFTKQNQVADETDSDVDPNTGKTEVITLAAGDNNLTVDAGVHTPQSAGLGNYVWFDDNKDGIQDATEDPIGGVTVTLYDVNNVAVKVAVTDDKGYYSFPDLAPGTYSVGFSAIPTIYKYGVPVVTSITLQNATGATTNLNNATDFTDSDADPITGITAPVSIAAGEYNPGLDAGISADLGSIGNYVWSDFDGNGNQTGEVTSGINGVVVYLQRETTPGSGIFLVVDSTTTKNDVSGNPGYYLFPGLPSGNYKVDFPTTIAGNLLTTLNAIAQTDSNSDADNVTGESPVVVINASGTGQDKDNTTIDAGYIVPPVAAIGNRVWLDNNKDGLQDATGEPGVAGVTVDLFLNGADGLPGTADDILLGSTVTDASGNYKFEGLTPSTGVASEYNVGFTPPANYTFTAPNAQADNNIDNNSDANPAVGLTFGRSGSINLSGNEYDSTIDAGLILPTPITASVGDYVWLDVDGDGTQDANEKGISGVVVTLKNSAGEVVATTITDANGGYLFQNVEPLNGYIVEFSQPIGYLPTLNTGALTDTANSDMNPSTFASAPFNVVAGDNIRYIDAGFVAQDPLKSSLGDKVWFDTNNDGIQDTDELGVAGITVILYDASGVTVLATTKTDALGNYIFNNLDAGTYVVGFDPLSLPGGTIFTAQNAVGSDSTSNSNADISTGKTAPIIVPAGTRNMTIDAGIYSAINTNSVGDYVWYDLDKDGTQDANEAPVPGVTATLYNAAGATIAITTTDANGKYLFPNLPNGDYSVGFSNLPEGMNFTSPEGVPSATGSDANKLGRTPTVSLIGGTNNRDLDAGIYPQGTPSETASLGNKIWYDLNNNGIQEDGETGVAGVTVTLKDAGTDGILGTADDGTDKVTKSNSQGEYIFTNLPAGNYAIEFSNLPAGYDTSPANTTDDTKDSDGGSISAGVSTTSVIALAPGEENLTVDLGINDASPLNTIGNYVWMDINKDGKQGLPSTEPPVSGVMVTLLNADGTVFDNDASLAGVQPKVTSTDANGYYLFTDLADGSYAVKFSNLPSGYEFTSKDATNTTDGSDANPATGVSNVVTVAGGQTDLTLDAGIFSNTKAALGNYVWFDANMDGLQDVTESPISGVLVTLFNAAGDSVACTITDANGKYLFPNLNPDTYTVGFTNLPNGVTFTTQNVNPLTGSDVDPGTGKTNPITLAAGEVNLNVDAGVSPLPTGGLGNLVWFDTNKDGVQDANEKGVPGVLVTLNDAVTGDGVASAITDGNGKYLFPNLDYTETYTATFSGLPTDSTYVFTTQTGPITGALNSDANTVTGLTSAASINAGEINPNVDAGIYVQTPLSLNILLTGGINTFENILTWTNTDDKDILHYELQKLDNGEFVTVATIASKQSSSFVNYKYLDAKISLVSTYQVKVTGINGVIKTSNVVVLTRDELLPFLSVSPNPVTDLATLKFFSSGNSDAIIKVMDIQGKVIRIINSSVSEGLNNITLDLSNLAAGSYSIQISCKTVPNIIKTIIKQ
jgi:hypothetical protein